MAKGAVSEVKRKQMAEAEAGQEKQNENEKEKKMRRTTVHTKKKVNAITKLEMGRNEHCFLGQSI